MCNCAGGGGSGYTPSYGTPNNQINNALVNIPNGGCDLTEEILLTWKQMLLCVKLNNKLELINLPLVSVNQMIGNVQSALNNPDNYCYYIPQLEYFRTNVLPRIIENASECL